MPHYKDLTGQRFGRLKILGLTEERTQTGGVVFSCLCDCGSLKKQSSASLKNGSARSCGCLAKESARRMMEKNTRNPFNAMSPVKHIYNVYRHNAKRNKRKFDIGFNDFIKLIEKNCFYCGRPPYNKSVYPDRQKYGKRTVVYNGIDRKKNNLGYIKGNVVPCCYICNIAKRDLSVVEFEEWIDALCRKRISERCPLMLPLFTPLEI